ncbi:MAG: hypothetical protein QOJ80_4089 [Mycobacterium sp.]|jgi:hypothetical protein|nr:hypothetical protein [Mycobacterium sp.]
MARRGPLRGAAIEGPCQTLALYRRRRTGHRRMGGLVQPALGYQTRAEYEHALTGTSHPASQPTPALAIH